LSLSFFTAEAAEVAEKIIFPILATDAVLSKVEGELRASILFFYLGELCVLCGFFSAVNPSNRFGLA
jgi:hypothetical protein